MNPNSSSKVTQSIEAASPSNKRKAEELSPEDDDNNGEEKGSTESDQVWGYDSFDDWDSSDEPNDHPDALEISRYLRHLYKSKGFLLEKEMVPKNLFQGFRRLNLDVYFKKPDLTGRDYMTIMAQVAIDRYNQTENKTLTLDSIVRAVVRMSCGVKAYITFMAKECPEGELVEYQAKAEKRVWQSNIHPIICRPAPKEQNDGVCDELATASHVKEI